MTDDVHLPEDHESELQPFQALLFRGNENRTKGAWPILYLDTVRRGRPAMRSLRSLDAAWYRLVWQHNLTVAGQRGVDMNDLVGEHNWVEFQLLLTPMEWFETEAYLKRREVCPDTSTHTPSFLVVEELWRWNGMVNRT